MKRTARAAIAALAVAWTIALSAVPATAEPASQLRAPSVDRDKATSWLNRELMSLGKDTAKDVGWSLVDALVDTQGQSIEKAVLSQMKWSCQSSPRRVTPGDPATFRHCGSKIEVPTPDGTYGRLFRYWVSGSRFGAESLVCKGRVARSCREVISSDWLFQIHQKVQMNGLMYDTWVAATFPASAPKSLKMDEAEGSAVIDDLRTNTRAILGDYFAMVDG